MIRKKKKKNLCSNWQVFVSDTDKQTLIDLMLRT